MGAGFAGSEAAIAASSEGLDVLLVTTSLDTVYMLAHARYPLEPPSGTLMERLLQGTDGATERWSLHRKAKYALEGQSGIHLLQSNVTSLVVDEGRVVGVRTWEGVERSARATALCVGSFLHARLEQGRLQEAAGRLGEMAYDELYDDLVSHALTFDSLRLELEEHGEGLPYRVDCKMLAPAELRGFRVERLPALYAAGVCAGGMTGYERSAARGLELGLQVARELQGS